MIKTKYIKGDELPYRIEIDRLSGAGISPAEAAMAALRAGGKIPAGCGDSGEAASYIFWNYQTNSSWVELIRILEKDSFK